MSEPATRSSLSRVRIDKPALRVLAHPLRSRLLSQLRVKGPATATALARALDTNTGATSYHLRKLAEVGLVRETGEGAGRERWWRAAHDMHSWSAEDFAGDPDAEAALEWLEGEYFRRFTDHAQDWAREQSRWPLAWRDAAGASDYLLRLTPAELRDMQREIFAVVERYQAAGEAAHLAGAAHTEAAHPTGAAAAEVASTGAAHDGAAHAEVAPTGPATTGPAPTEARTEADTDRRRVLLYLHCFPEPESGA